MSCASDSERIAGLDQGDEILQKIAQSAGHWEFMHKPPTTLGDVLYAKSKAPVPEQDWAALVQSIAAGDQLALHALYERAHRPVFTLIMRMTANRETAEVCRMLKVDHDQGAREVMAVRIIELARRGERDPKRLRDRVLQEASATPSVVDAAPVPMRQSPR